MSLTDREITLCLSGDANPGWFCKECAGYAVIDKGKVKLKMACSHPCLHKTQAKALGVEVGDLLRHDARIEEVRDYVRRRG